MAEANEDGPNDLQKKIIRQVEYYFGDINLPKDRFLQEKIKEDDGWVSMETMLSFNRLKAISDDREVICNALKKSSTGLMEVNEDLTKIRRSPAKPLPDNSKERKDDLNARSVYVKGFPLDSTLDALMEFFEKHGKIDNIFMRRNKPDKTFKGSVFVTFTDTEEEKAFLNEEGIKYQDAELIKLTKDQYFKQKAEEAKKKKKGNSTADERGEAKKMEEEKKIDEQMTKGAVLFIKGLTKETTMEEVKAFFGDYANVAWVEFAKGDDKALVRFQEAEAEAAQNKARVAGDGKIVIHNAELETRVLEGDEEKEYWRKMFRDIADRKKNKNKNFQNRKRKFGGRSHKQGSKDADGETAKKRRSSAEKK